MLLIPYISFTPEERKFKLFWGEDLFISCYLDITTSCLPLTRSSFSIYQHWKKRKSEKRNWLSKEERVISFSLAMLYRVCAYISDLIWCSHQHPVVGILFPLRLRKWRLRIKWFALSHLLVREELKFKTDFFPYSKFHDFSALFCCLRESFFVPALGKALMLPLSVGDGEEEVRSCSRSDWTKRS